MTLQHPTFGGFVLAGGYQLFARTARGKQDMCSKLPCHEKQPHNGHGSGKQGVSLEYDFHATCL